MSDIAGPPRRSTDMDDDDTVRAELAQLLEVVEQHLVDLADGRMPDAVLGGPHADGQVP